MKLLAQLIEIANDRRLSMDDLALLLVLRDNESIGPKRIAEVFRVSLPTVTGRMEKLESRQLITRAKGRPDRRTISVSLTDKGFMTLSGIEPESGSLVAPEGWGE